MRDRILCGERADPKAANAEKAPCGGSYAVLPQVALSNTALVSTQEGERMSISAFLGFFDCVARIKKARFLEISRGELDTLCVVESLFRGTIVDFDFGSHSGGGKATRFAVN
jgi:hypothetical protein